MVEGEVIRGAQIVEKVLEDAENLENAVARRRRAGGSGDGGCIGYNDSKVAIGNHTHTPAAGEESA